MRPNSHDRSLNSRVPIRENHRRQAIWFVVIVAMVIPFSLVSAQTQPAVSYTVGIWLADTKDANTIAPINTAIYPVSLVLCGQPRQPGSPNVVNPDEGRLDDPANVALDCVVSIGPQVRTLASGKYKAALRVNGRAESSAYGSWSDVFERQGPPPPPSIVRLN